MTETANPETGAVVDMDSAVESLIAEEPATEEAEAPQEEQETEEVSAESEDAAPEEVEEPESDEPEDADEETDEPDDRQYTVKVNGQEFEVNETELLAGYQKGADYQNKTTELAEERKTLAAQSQHNNELRGQLEAALAKYAAPAEQEPDWVKLSNELDPWEFQQRQAVWQQSQAAKGQAHQAAQAMQHQRHAQVVSENSVQLLEAFPDWKGDQAKFEADRTEMRAAAAHYGFTDQEFLAATDYRSFVLLRDAMIGRKVTAAKKTPPKKIPKKATKVLKPGASETTATRKAKGKTTLRDNLRKQGDVDAGVAFLLGG